MYLDNPALFTDYYEVSMVQGYIGSGIADKTATFDYFFRSLPFDSGYLIFAGLSDLIQTLESFIFTKDDLQFLESIGLSTTCTEWLKKFKFQGSVYSVQEGEPVFPGEPVLRVEGGLAELQLIETLLLNILNFQSLIATKASRLRSAAGDKKVIDFGLRRAQGLGGIHASKAAILGGVDATSNLYSAHRFGLASGGTMAHSWVQSFTNELTAFRSYAEIWPDDTVLLVDTYDTLESGVPNAITVAKEMRDRGHELQGIRIDSGDLAWFSRQARTMLDQAGFSGVKIAASNQIDEDVICALNSQDAPIDLFGVGTRLVTADGAPALDGVYKLSSIGGEPTLKISDSPEKCTLPGNKEIIRLSDENGMFQADGIILTHEANNIPEQFILNDSGHIASGRFHHEHLLNPVMIGGKVVDELPNLHSSASYVQDRLKKLPDEFRRLREPDHYRLGYSEELLDLQKNLIREKKLRYETE